MTAYMIHDPARTDREPYIEIARQHVGDLVLVEPIKHTSSMISCTLTHKYILERVMGECDKKNASLCTAWVLEDDVKFTSHFTLGRWKHLVEWLTISPYHILVGGAAASSGGRRVSRHIAEVSNFSSTHCYALRADVIPLVLKQASEQHFDGLLTRAPIRKLVVAPFMATQWPGRSSIRNRPVDDTGTFHKAEAALLRILHGS